MGDRYKHGLFKSKPDKELRYTGRYYEYAEVISCKLFSSNLYYLSLAIF